jgi:hypothetical protein
MLRRPLVFVSLAIAAQLACRASLESQSAPIQTAEQCRASQAQLVRLVEALPDRGLALRGRNDLPVATLGGVIGSGHVVDISTDALRFDGETLPGLGDEERIESLRQRLEAGDSRLARSPSLLYVAGSRDLDVRTLRSYLGVIPRHFDIHLVFQSPEPDAAKKSDAPGPSFADQLLSERDLPTRHALARAAYARHARCPALIAAVDAAPAGNPNERWPVLRDGLRRTLPSCKCSELDSDELREVILAEQRAGAAAVGALPLEFMRDERCGASLGLTPLQKLVQDIEGFDEQFSGGYGRESLDFEQVVTNDRLLNYLCPALPGETLAALQRAKRTFYWKIQGQSGCQPWQFEPLAPGSPMGTWRRKPAEGAADLAVYYWQGAEEIRLYGPITDPASKPTDEREWTCNQNFRMRGIDSVSIELERGRWFFDAAACEKAHAEQAAFPGCVAALAGGPAEEPSTTPATFPAPGDEAN